MSDELELRRLADLTDAELSELYAPRGEPWLRVNFVSTVDGAAQGADGLSKSINNDADGRVFGMLRERADCLVVAAGTLREEAYEVPEVPLVVVTRSADLPPSLADAPDGRILMATVASADGLAEARKELGEENVLVLGDEEVDLAALKSTLAGRGWTEQLCEGGPALFGSLLAAGVVDELCHTVVPRLFAGDHKRISGGDEVDVELKPITLLEQDGTLLARWLTA